MNGNGGRRIPKVVFTGGPCGGKSTVLCRAEQRLGEYGFQVCIVPEAATEFKLGGLRVAGDRLAISAFQDLLLQSILAKEAMWEKAANQFKGPRDKTVILCDRGILDGLAYMEREAFNRLVNRYCGSLIHARDKSYDGVIHLRSLAVTKPALYMELRATNPVREETAEEARELDALTERAWTGHPHLHVIGQTETMEEKVGQAIQAICRILGIPKPIEIEEKFVVKDFNPAAIPDAVAIEIIQHYLVSDESGTEERIRRRGQFGHYVYYHTTKRPIGQGVRSEQERQISAAEYRELRRRTDPNLAAIGKVRYCFVYAGQYFEFDYFAERRLGFDLLEIELTEEGREVRLPDYLVNHVEKVTGKKRYSNYEIARQLRHV